MTWTDSPVRPFCSLTCKLVDLGRWLDESYRVPGDPLASRPDPDPDGRRADG